MWLPTFQEKTLIVFCIESTVNTKCEAVGKSFDYLCGLARANVICNEVRFLEKGEGWRKGVY